MDFPDLKEFAADLVSVVSAHRREHSCASAAYCEVERQIVEMAKAEPFTLRALLPSPASPVHMGPSTVGGFVADALMEAAARHRAAVESQKLQHCAGALYYSHHTPQQRTTVPWSLLAYDERQRYIRDAGTVIAAADDFVRTRRV